MARIFDGSFKDFRSKLRLVGFNSYWEKHPNGVWQLKTKCGCTLSWSDTQRTFWTQGGADQKERLDNLLGAYFEDDPAAYRVVVIGNEDKMPYEQLVATLNAAGLDVISAGGA